MQRLSDDQKEEDLCVTFGEKTFEVTVSGSGEEVKADFGELEFIGGGYCTTKQKLTEMTLSSRWCLGHPVMVANVNGREVIVQV